MKLQLLFHGSAVLVLLTFLLIAVNCCCELAEVRASGLLTMNIVVASTRTRSSMPGGLTSLLVLLQSLGLSFPTAHS